MKIQKNTKKYKKIQKNTKNIENTENTETDIQHERESSIFQEELIQNTSKRTKSITQNYTFVQFAFKYIY